MDVISKVISLAIASKWCRVWKDEGDSTYGVSLVLVARPESGKTYNFMRFMGNKGLEIIQDINYEKLLDLVYNIASGSRKVNTVLIPDFWKILAKKKHTVENFITLLNILIEEGAFNIQAGKRLIIYPKPIRLNVVLATTPAEFFMRRNIIGITGFISRVVPISYSLSHERVRKIRNKIKGIEEEIDEGPIKLNLPDDIVDIKVDKEYINELESLALELNNKIATQLRLKENEMGYGFRLTRSLVKLAAGNALLQGRDYLTDEDIRVIYKLADYIGFDFNSI